MMKPIILIGLTGAGKSTLGRLLARRLHCPFVDTDHEIEQQTGVSIKSIFDIEGEAGFRQREHKTLAHAIDRLPEQPLVLATGGGIVLLPENRTLLQQTHASIVYLHATPEHSWRRLQHDRSRPLLQNADPLGTLRRLYGERDPLYRSVATCILDVAQGSAEQLVEELLKKLESGQ